MIRPIWPGTRLLALGVAMALAGACDYTREHSDEMPPGVTTTGSLPEGDVSRNRQPGASARDSADRATILSSSVELIQAAALRPGGDNFRMATQQLNQFFEGTPAADYQIEPMARAFLRDQLPAELLTELEKPAWSPRTDARHLEDCMLYSSVAGRVGGTGDDLDRVTRIFDWLVRQIQLVPAGSLGTRRLPQVAARPYDVLFRGMATESEGFWAERSWLFMSLCRQLGIDAGLITYSRGNVVEPPAARSSQKGDAGGNLLASPKAPKPTIPWICAALVNGKAYLFDARIGLAVPGPGGLGVATLDEALADGSVLERLNLPGQLPYGTSRASLLASPTKIGILIDSSQGFFSPKMKLLQGQLAGKNRTILYRNPAEQREHFAQVLGNKLGEVKLWSLPLQVELQLFRNPQFVESTKQSLMLFAPDFPLIYARIKQLRGDLPQAIQEYVSFRLGQNVPTATDKNKVIPKEVQQGLDVYATNFLALAQLERNNLEQAEQMFQRLLEMLPEPGANQPYYNMFRWGAHANLGRIHEARGDTRRAIAHYAQIDPTMQNQGNLVRARELVWSDPMAPPPEPLAPAPAPPAR